MQLTDFLRLVETEVNRAVRAITAASQEQHVDHDLARAYIRPLIQVRETARGNRSRLMAPVTRPTGGGVKTNVGDPLPKGDSQQKKK
jgi:hypothetical protein